jgi:hypothetical protein
LGRLARLAAQESKVLQVLLELVLREQQVRLECREFKAFKDQLVALVLLVSERLARLVQPELVCKGRQELLAPLVLGVEQPEQGLMLYFF